MEPRRSLYDLIALVTDTIAFRMAGIVVVFAIIAIAISPKLLIRDEAGRPVAEPQFLPTAEISQPLPALVQGRPVPPETVATLKAVEPEVFCAQMASLGVVEPKKQFEAVYGDPWECPPKTLELVDAGDAAEKTSIFTTIRGGSQRPVLIRLKLNELDPQTEQAARATVLRVVQSAARSHGVEVPAEFAAAIAQLSGVDATIRHVKFKIATEREDPRRHNIFLSFVP